MGRFGTRLATILALIITLWLIWQKIHFVVFVSIPWWGLLLGALVLFFAIDYVLSRLFRSSP